MPTGDVTWQFVPDTDGDDMGKEGGEGKWGRGSGDRKSSIAYSRQLCTTDDQ